jgi:hypothetical protein
MIRRAWRAAVLVAAGVSLMAPTMVRREPAPDLAKFWTGFRRAVQKRDRKVLDKVIFFPLENRGRNDDQPVWKWKKEDLWLYWDGFLARVEWRRDMGPDPVAISRRAVIERWETLPAEVLAKAEQTRSFRVADLEFRLLRGQWRLVRLYRGDE